MVIWRHQLEEKDKLKIELLVKQCDDISNNIRNVTNIQQQLITIGILLFTGVLIYGIEHQTTNPQLLSTLLILFFPFIFLALLLFGLFTHGEIKSLGGYKRFLEEEINTNFGEDLFLWESFVVKPKESLLGAQSDRYNYLLYLVLYTIPSYFSFILVLDIYKNSQYKNLFVLLFSFFLLLGGIILYASLNKVTKRHEEVYQNVKNHKEKKDC